MNRRVGINDRYEVEIDENNHTLLEFSDAYHKPNGKLVKSRWKVVGYYSSMSNALSAVKNRLILDDKKVGIIEHCMDLVDAAEEICAKQRIQSTAT